MGEEHLAILNNGTVSSVSWQRYYEKRSLFSRQISLHKRTAHQSQWHTRLCINSPERRQCQPADINKCRGHQPSRKQQRRQARHYASNDNDAQFIENDLPRTRIIRQTATHDIAEFDVERLSLVPIAARLIMPSRLASSHRR
jgi:hypothetical protein